MKLHEFGLFLKTIKEIIVSCGQAEVLVLMNIALCLNNVLQNGCINCYTSMMNQTA